MNQDDNPIARPKRGFAAMRPEEQKRIASLGGRAAHASGHAHQFTSEQARQAGLKRHAKDGPPKPEQQASCPG